MVVVLTSGSSLLPPLPALAWPLHGAPEDPALSGDEPVVKAGDHALIVGGEPLLHPSALQWLSRLRDDGAAAVEAWTDGRILTKRGAIDRLKDAGLTHVGVVLFGAQRAGHDFVAGVDGHFQTAIKGLRIAHKLGLKTAVVVPLLRPTFRELPLLVKRSLAVGVQRFDFVGLQGPDRTRHGLLPHWNMVSPHLIDALRIADAAGRKAASWNVPACYLGPHHETARWSSLSAPHIINHFKAKHVAACAACRLQTSCRGPLLSHLSQHGQSGIQAV